MREVGIDARIADGEMALVDEFFSLPAKARAEELEAAILDPEVDLVLCGTGGWNAIDVLRHLDWNRLEGHEKPIVGYSDISVLTTAFHARLGWRTYYGPNLASIANDEDPQFTLGSLLAALAGDVQTLRSTATMTESGAGPGRPSKKLDDPGMRVVATGVAEGAVFGGNLGTLFLMQGTPFWPDFSGDVILFIEEDALAKEYTLIEALRRVESLLMQPGLVGHVKGLVLGRFQEDAGVSQDNLAEGLRRIESLRGCPLVTGAPFGHTNPVVTLPIGGQARVDAPDATSVPRITVSS